MAKPTVGYLGMGIMGSAMANRLIDAGFDVTVWNRTKERCEPHAAKGAKVADFPQAVVEACDIVFACTSDPESSRQVVFGERGVLAGMSPGKKYVDMSTVDEACAIEIAAAIKSKGGVFLEAPMCGSKAPAINGQLIILTAGDASLKHDAQPCFDVMGKRTFFLGEVGAGARMKLVVNMVMAINIQALSEALALGQRAGLNGSDVIAVLEEGSLKSPMYSLKGPKMLEGDYAPNFPLKHQQKDVRLAMALGQRLGQPLPAAAVVNDVFMAAIAAGQGDFDMSAIFEISKL